MSVNTSAIFAELSRVASSDGFKSANRAAINAITREKALEAVDRLADCINSAIGSSGLNGAAIAAVGEASAGGAHEVGIGQFEGSVYIPDNARPSLYAAKYGSVISMAQLLNNGYSAGGVVHGIWHGSEISSLQSRPGAHFVSQGVADFNGNYGAAYNAHAEACNGFD